jgi:hypothetical protein
VKMHPDVWAWKDRTLLLIMLMHLADIVNPARTPTIAIKWGTLIVNEFIAQARPSSRVPSKSLVLALDIITNGNTE